MIHIYTGDGKGKTTAGFGLVLRAIGAGLNVHVVQFGKTEPSSEGRLLIERGLCPVEAFWAEGFLMPGDDPKPFKESVQRGVERIQEVLKKPPDIGIIDPIIEDDIANRPDILLIDEGCVALAMDLMTRQQMEAIIELANDTELVITGRGAPSWLIERADLVTEMKKIKHYYDKGQDARRGVEF